MRRFTWLAWETGKKRYGHRLLSFFSAAGAVDFLLPAYMEHAIAKVGTWLEEIAAIKQAGIEAPKPNSGMPESGGQVDNNISFSYFLTPNFRHTCLTHPIGLEANSDGTFRHFRHLAQTKWHPCHHDAQVARIAILTAQPEKLMIH